MKKKFIFAVLSFLSLFFIWQCSDKNEKGTLNLKNSLNYRVNQLNKAIAEVKNTQGYQIITLSDNNTTKSLTTDNFTKGDSIDLEDIKGIYDYHPSNYKKWCFVCFDQLFKKTGDSSILVVRLPQEKIFFPHRFNSMKTADSLLVNNFEIAATDYHFYLMHGYAFDYNLNAGFKLDGTSIGSLLINSSIDTTHTSKYTANYTFETGFKVKVEQQLSDTSITSFALEDESGILLKESFKKIKTDTHHSEKEYTLTIGNIDIVKSSEVDSVMIYVGGVLQQNAKVEFVDMDGSEDQSICKKRDIQITFDDNSVVLLSELIGPSLETMKGLIGSMFNMYFASNIVDYIAWNIYRNKN